MNPIPGSPAYRTAFVRESLSRLLRDRPGEVRLEGKMMRELGPLEYQQVKVWAQLLEDFMASGKVSGLVGFVQSADRSGNGDMVWKLTWDPGVPQQRSIDAPTGEGLPGPGHARLEDHRSDKGDPVEGGD